MRRFWWLWCLVALAATGCAGQDFAAWVHEMKDDPATICAYISSPYASLTFARTNIQNGDVSCQGGSLTVKSQGAQVGVPLTVVPSVTLGTPTVTTPNR